MSSGTPARILTLFGLMVVGGVFMGLVMGRAHLDLYNYAIPGLAFGMGDVDYHVQGFILVLLIGSAIFLLGLLPIIMASEKPWFFRLIVMAFLAKVVVTIFRLFWVWGIKGGADSGLYYGTGLRLGPSIRQLDFSVVPPLFSPGTEFAQLFSTFVMALTGPTLPGSFLFYAFLSFLGAICYYKAFRTAFPEGNHKLYALLIFFHPSLLFWLSGNGKDAPMALFIGMVAFGMALLLKRGSIRAWFLLFLGMAGIMMIRPHIGGLLAIAMALPLIIRPPVRSQSLAPLIRVGYMIVGIVVAWFLVNNAADYLRLESTSIEATLGKYESLISDAERGGASFTPTPITHPLGIPMAFVTVFFRPLPWEAHNTAALVLSFEGILFALLVMWRLGAIRRAVFAVKSNPYLIFVIVYSVAAMLAFTTIGNFSLLGRQRLMMLPIFFMLLAFPTRKEAARDQLANDDTEEEGYLMGQSLPMNR